MRKSKAKALIINFQHIVVVRLIGTGLTTPPILKKCPNHRGHNMQFGGIKFVIFRVLQQFLLALGLVLVLICFSGFNADGAIAASRSKLEIIGDRIEQLKIYIDQNNWITVKTYIHGPLGQVRQDIAQSIRLLKDQSKAKEVSTKFFNDLIKIDFAAAERDIDKTLNAYGETKADFEQLVKILKP